MNSNLQAARARVAALFRRTWVRVLTGLVLAFLLFILLLPYGLQQGLQHWLVKNGADRAQVGKFAANLFTGRFAIHGMAVEREGRNVLTDSLLALDLNLGALFTKKVHVQRVVYDKASIDLEQLADGRWRFTSYVTGPAGEQVEVQAQDASASPWNVLVNEMRLTDCQVRLKTPTLQLTLTIDSAELDRFSTEPGAEGGTFRLKGRINDAPLELHLDRLQVAPQLDLGGTLRLSGFDLGRLAALLAPTVQPATGKAGLDGRLQFSLDADGNPRAAYDGRIELADADVGVAATAIREQRAVWQGKLAYTGRQAGATVSVDGTLDGKGLAVELPQGAMAFKAGQLQLKGPIEAAIGTPFTLTGKAALTLAQADLGLPAGTLALDTTGWTGTITVAAGAADAPFTITTDGAWKTGGLSFTRPQPELSYRQGEILLEGRSETSLGKNVQSGFDGRILLGGLDLRLPDLNATDRELSWQGKIGYADAKQPTVNLNGTLNNKALSLTVPASRTLLTQETLTIDTDGGLVLADRPGLTGKASVRAGVTRLHTGDAKQPLVSVKDFTTTGLEAPSGQTIKAQRTQVQGIEVLVEGDLPLVVQVPEVDIAAVESRDWNTVGAGAVTVRNVRAVPRSGKGEIATLRQLSVNRPKMAKDGQVTATTVQLDGLRMLPAPDSPKDAAALQLGRVRLMAPAWSAARGLGAESLAFDDLVARLVREKNGELQVHQQLAAMRPAGSTAAAKAPAKAATAKAPAVPPAQAASAAGTVAIKTVSVQGKSSLRIEDRSLPEPFLSEAEIKRLEISDLRTSADAGPMTVNLEALFDQRAPLAVKGTMTPFAQAPGIDGTVSLKNYPLARLSPYVIQSVGLALSSGQLNLASTVKVADQKMRMNNSLHLKKLETATISKELAKQLDNRLPLPLESAISFLKDSNGDLKLDIPIEGSLSELNVGIADLLITALGKAIVPAASSYLVYALGPYGALAYVGMKVGENMMKASLAPVVFQPGEHELTAEHRAYLERVAKVMQDRPDMEVNLCPSAPAWELLSKRALAKAADTDIPVDEKDRQKLTKLGQERAQAILDHLADTHGIDRGRLMICETQIPTEKSKQPTVDLQL